MARKSSSTPKKSVLRMRLTPDEARERIKKKRVREGGPLVRKPKLKSKGAFSGTYPAKKKAKKKVVKKVAKKDEKKVEKKTEKKVKKKVVDRRGMEAIPPEKKPRYTSATLDTKDLKNWIPSRTPVPKYVEEGTAKKAAKRPATVGAQATNKAMSKRREEMRENPSFKLRAAAADKKREAEDKLSAARAMVIAVKGSVGGKPKTKAPPSLKLPSSQDKPTGLEPGTYKQKGGLAYLENVPITKPIREGSNEDFYNLVRGALRTVKGRRKVSQDLPKAKISPLAPTKKVKSGPERTLPPMPKPIKVPMSKEPVPLAAPKPSQKGKDEPKSINYRFEEGGIPYSRYKSKGGDVVAKTHSGGRFFDNLLRGLFPGALEKATGEELTGKRKRK